MAQPTSLPAVSRRLNTLLNLAFNYAGIGLVVVQGIVLVPLYLDRIPVGLYGAWLATGNLLAWLELVDPGTSDVVRQRVAQTYGAGDRAALARTIGTGLRLSLGFALLPLLAWPLADRVAAFVHLVGPDAATLALSLRLGLLGVALSIASYGFAAVCNGLQLALKSGIWFIGAGVFGIAVTVAMLLGGYGLISIPVGLCLRAGVMCLSFAAIVFRWRREHLPEPATLDPVEARAILSLTVSTFTARVGTTLLDRLDAMLTSRVLGNGQTVVYTATGRALEPVRMVAVSIPTSLMPSLAHMVGAGERGEVARTVALLNQVPGTIAAVGAGSVAALDAVFVRVWVGPRLYGGPGLASLLAVAAALSVFSMTLNRVVYSLGAIRRASWVSLAEAVVKVPLQYALLRSVGLAGMPLATCIASVAVSGWYLPSVVAGLVGEAPRVHVLRWAGNVAKVLAAVALGRGLHAALARLPIDWTWGRFLVAALLVGGFFAALGLWVDADLRVSLARTEAVEVLNRHASEDWSVTLAETGEHTMTGGRVAALRRYVENDDLFMVTYGDGVSDVDIGALVAFHRSHGKVATVTAVHPPGRFGELGIRDGLVQEFNEKPQTTLGFINGGFMVFDAKRAWDYIPAGNPGLVLEVEPLQSLANAGELVAYEHHGFWQPMDTLREYTQLNQQWAAGTAPWKTWADDAR